MKNVLRKKIPVLLISLLITSISLTGCGATKSSTTNDSPSTPKKVTLTFWNGFTATDGDVLKEIVKGYNDKNSDKVEIKMDIMPWGQLFQKLPPSIATNTAPSFVLMGPANIVEYINNGQVQDMSDFFTSTGADKSNFSDASLSLGNFKGKQYGIPMQNFGIYLYWNKDLYKAAGLDPEKGPESLEQMAEYAVKLTDAKKGQFGLGLPIGGAPQYYATFLRANGGEAVDLKNMKSVLNTPDNIKTFDFIRDLTFNKKVSPKGVTGANMDSLMFSGKVAMYMNGPWLVPGLKKNNVNFGVSLIPKGSVKQNTILDGSIFAIPKGTPPDQKKAVYDFVKYWNTTEICKEWSVKNGFPPYLKSVTEDATIKSDPTLSVMSTMSAVATPWNLGLTSTGKIDNDILYPMVEALQSGGDTSNLVKKASDQLDVVLKSEK